MSHAQAPSGSAANRPGSDLERLLGRLTAGTEGLLETIERDAADEAVSATAGELWDVVDALEGLLGTVDLERLPAAVDAEAVPDLVDVDGLAAALSDRNPDAALDLSSLRRAVRLRRLWNAVDLVAFRAAAGRLGTELDDVIDLAALAGSGRPDGSGRPGRSTAATDLERFLEAVTPEAKRAAIQQQGAKGAKRARTGVLAGHDRFADLYGEHQRGAGYAGRRPVSKNPTAVSTLPAGPLPASVSTRVSTVPANVRHARIDAPPRIYARRWRATRRR